MACGFHRFRSVGAIRRLLLGVAVLGLLAAASPPGALGQPRGAGDGVVGCPWRPWGSGMPGSGSGRMGMGDQGFIVMMIPHHEGAIAMADLALRKAVHPELRALAQRISSSQTRENEQMRRWYQQWFGTPVPSWAQGPGGRPGCGNFRSGMGMSMGMPGFDVSLEILNEAVNFDQAFIEQMIPHHRMGVMMASMAQVNAQHPELRALEQTMVQVQSQEILEMTRWYRQWFAVPTGR